MRELIDSFWRAAAYCLHPRVIWLSLLPLLLGGALAGGLAYFFWDDALAAVRERIDSWAMTATLLGWLSSVGLEGLRAAFAPLIVVALSVPLLVIVSLLAVALLMMPRLVTLVAKRRFPLLERRHGAPVWQGALWSLWSTLLALAALLLSLPLWLIPPLALLLPPLIWGWLAYRVMSFDALGEHASPDERRAVMQEERLSLLAIGLVSGYLGAAPALVWALGAIALAFAPFLIVLSMWLYTLVFAFSSLWFAHHCLAALDRRRARPIEAAPAVPALDAVAAPAPSAATTPPWPPAA
jgi:hypothetical protein